MASSKKSGGKKTGKRKGKPRAKSSKPSKATAPKPQPSQERATNERPYRPAILRDDDEREDGVGQRQPDTTAPRARARYEDVLADKLRKGDHVEELLVDGRYSETQVARRIALEWGCTTRHAQRWVDAVKIRLREDHGRTREERRAMVRTKLGRIYQRAMTRKKAVVVGGFDKYAELYDDPDAKGAALAVELEMKLDGLADEKPQTTEVSVNVNALQVYQQVYGIAPMLDAPALPAKRAPVPPITADVEVGP